jgi:hypothetical protein
MSKAKHKYSPGESFIHKKSLKKIVTIKKCYMQKGIPYYEVRIQREGLKRPVIYNYAYKFIETAIKQFYIPARKLAKLYATTT